MSRRVNLYVVLVVLSAVMAVPASGLAGTGGSSLAPGAGPGAGTGAGTGNSSALGAIVVPGNVTVTSTGNGITLVTNASAMLRNQMSFTGNAGPRAAGDTIEIDRLGRQTNWQWSPTVQATVGGDGSFSAVWRAEHIGRFSIRALITQPASASAAAALPTVTVTIYRVALATLYGPGFFGQRTACGQKLTPSTLGVANRTLKCGTQVAIDYRGRTIVVPVIDRGPYANGADWDLTEATAKLLGMNGTGRIGAVSLPPHP